MRLPVQSIGINGRRLGNRAQSAVGIQPAKGLGEIVWEELVKRVVERVLDKVEDVGGDIVEGVVNPDWTFPGRLTGPGTWNPNPF